MAKAVALTADDLIPPSKQRQTTAMRQRGVTSSANQIPLQFRMPPEFIHAFKQAALDRHMKLNELLNYCFTEIMKRDEAALPKAR
jgi:hypothetical protein